jgi:hypothetical protein
MEVPRGPESPPPDGSAATDDIVGPTIAMPNDRTMACPVVSSRCVSVCPLFRDVTS